MLKIIVLRFKLIILFAILFCSCKTQKKTISTPSLSTQEYISRYADISLSEMKRTGVPASITLAQGILESGAGSSELARKANNHFGIKCGASWRGKSMGRKDDDYKNGRLRKSCFRKYDRAESSFRDHSEFLTDPKKAYRYGFLFDLAITDYKAWANGLQKAGYATSRSYGSKLIRIIEQYRLDQYDLGIQPPPRQETPTEGVYHTVKKGDTLYSIGRKYDTTVDQLRKLNTLESDHLSIGQKLLVK